MANIPVALQLYTVRDMTARDFLGTLRHVAKVGYTAVEFAGMGGIEPTDMRKALDDLGMKAAGMHIGYDEVREPSKRARVFDDARILGCRYFAVSGNHGSAVAWRRSGEELARAGAEFAANGLTLSFHNHAAEFALYDGVPGLEIMYQVADARYLKAQPDVYWVTRGGQDPSEFIRCHAARCPTVHCKDLEKGGTGFFAEVGEGVLDWLGIFQACETVGGIEWYIVEQDECRRPSIESVRISLENLKKWGKA